MADAVIREPRAGGGQASPGSEGLSHSEGPGRTQAKNVQSWGAQNYMFVFAQSILIPTMGTSQSHQGWGWWPSGVFEIKSFLKCHLSQDTRPPTPARWPRAHSDGRCHPQAPAPGGQVLWSLCRLRVPFCPGPWTRGGGSSRPTSGKS